MTELAIRWNGGDHSTAAVSGRYTARKAVDYTKTAADTVVDEKRVNDGKVRCIAEAAWAGKG